MEIFIGKSKSERILWVLEINQSFRSVFDLRFLYMNPKIRVYWNIYEWIEICGNSVDIDKEVISWNLLGNDWIFFQLSNSWQDNLKIPEQQWLAKLW